MPFSHLVIELTRGAETPGKGPDDIPVGEEADRGHVHHVFARRELERFERTVGVVELMGHLAGGSGQLQVVGGGCRVHDSDELLVAATHDPVMRFQGRDTGQEILPGLGLHARFAVLGLDDLEEVHRPLTFRSSHTGLPHRRSHFC